MGSLHVPHRACYLLVATVLRGQGRGKSQSLTLGKPAVQCRACSRAVTNGSRYLLGGCSAETWFSGTESAGEDAMANAPRALARTASAMCPSCSTPSFCPRMTSLPHVPAAAVAFVASARLRRYPGYISDPRRAPHVVMLRHVLLLELAGRLSWPRAARAEPRASISFTVHAQHA